MPMKLDILLASGVGYNFLLGMDGGCGYFI
jgi:hypothetical protein